MKSHRKRFLLHFGPEAPLLREEAAMALRLAAQLAPKSRPTFRLGSNGNRYANFTACSLDFAHLLEQKAEEVFKTELNEACLLSRIAFRARLQLNGPEAGIVAYRGYILALLLRQQSRYDVARDLMIDVLAEKTSIFGAYDPQTLSCANELAFTLLDNDQPQKAARIPKATITHAIRSGVQNRDLWAFESNLGDAYRKMGRLKDAYRLEWEVWRKRTLQLGEAHQDSLTSLNNLATTTRELGRLAETRELQWKVVRGRRKEKNGNPHHLTTALGNLAVTLYQLGEIREAIRLEREVLARRQQECGPDHLDSLIAKNNLSGSLRDIGEIAEARQLLEEVLADSLRLHHEEHGEMLTACMNLGDLLVRFGEVALAEGYARRAYSLHRRRFGAKHVSTLLAKGSLAAILSAKQEHTKALQMRRSIAADSESQLGEGHFVTLLARNDLADALVNCRRYAAAQQLYRAVIRRSLRALGPEHGDRLAARLSLAEVLAAQGQKGSAVRQLLHIVTALRKKTFASTEDFALAHKTFARALELTPTKRWAKPLREVGRLLSASLCVLDSRSLGILRPDYLGFNEVWLHYCVQHSFEDLLLPLMASQGFDQIAFDGLAIEPAGPSRPQLSEWFAAIQSLRAARLTIHHLKLRMTHEGPDYQDKTNHQLKQELNRQLAVEKKARLRFERARRRLGSTGIWPATEKLTLTVSALAGSLRSEETLIVLYRAANKCYGALVLTAEEQQLVDLDGLPVLAESSLRRHDRLFCHRRHGLRFVAPAADDRNIPCSLPLDNASQAGLSLDEVGREHFWRPLENTGLLRSRVMIVTTLGVQNLPFEAGNSGRETEYFSSLGAAYRYTQSRTARPAASFPGKLLAFGDGAWQSSYPIPFVEAEAKLIAALVPGSVRVTAEQLKRQIRRKSGNSYPAVSIACHGVAVGGEAGQYSLLVIDVEHRQYLSPLDFDRSVVRGLYLSACLGGVMSDTPPSGARPLSERMSWRRDV